MAGLTKVASLLKTAANALSKFESEAQILRSKVAKLEEAAKEAEKEAKARNLAERLTLDDDVIKELNERTASLKGEDLALVEKAMELDLTKKVASIGELNKDSVVGNDAASLFRSQILALKK